MPPALSYSLVRWRMERSPPREAGVTFFGSERRVRRRLVAAAEEERFSRRKHDGERLGPGRHGPDQ